MNFGFTEEQQLLRSELRKFLDQNCPLAEVRKLAESPAGYSSSLWQRMAELGWLGLLVPEEHGGAGLGWVDLVVLLEETGRTLFPSPLIATQLAATAIADAGSDEQKARWLPGLAAGTSIGTLALLEESDRLDAAGFALEGKPDGDGFALHGEKRFVLDAGNADLFVVAFRSGSGPEEISLGVVERGATGLDVEPHTTMDTTKRMGRLRFDDVRVPADALLGRAGAGWGEVSHLLGCGAAAVTAEVIGAAEAALDLTVGYAKQRIQFDAPIGRFQGVKHPLAEMYVDIESYKSLLYYAVWLLDENPQEAALSISRAKAFAGESFAKMGIDCVQLHGGIGYTWEYDIQLYLKRAKWARPAFGGSAYHYERIATLGGL